MTVLSVPVQSYALRGAQPEEMVPTIALPLSESRLTVAELIRHTIIEQLSELTVRQMLDSVLARERIARQYLSAAEIAEQAASGSVRGPAVPAAAVQPPRFDVEHEVTKAWRGFERRAFRVVVDGQMPTNLSEQLALRPDSKVAFMRLTPLVGG